MRRTTPSPGSTGSAATRRWSNIPHCSLRLARRSQRCLSDIYDRAACRTDTRQKGFVMGDGNSEWWRGCVIYQIYPRSFQDTTGNGSGDLRGITSRLAYVASLGVDAVWLSPFFKSPMADMGYDVSDYRDVDPMFGGMENFDALVAEAHRLGLKLIIDQVISHSSDKHEWF